MSIRPEQLARPEGFRNLLDFVILLRGPTSPFLPSEWASQAIMGYLRNELDPLPARPAVDHGEPPSSRWARCCIAALYRAGVHQGAGGRRALHSRRLRGAGRSDRCSAGCPVAKREFVLKDIKLFFRDTDAVEPADPARGAGGGVPVQHPGAAAASRRAGRVLLRQPRLVL